MTGSSFRPNSMFSERVPFLSLDKIAESGQCFRWQNSSDGDFTVPVAGHLAHMRQEGELLVVEHDGPSDAFWRRYLDLDSDYEEYARRLSAFPHMMQAIEFGRGLRVLNQPFFETCISYIVSQNNNITRIKNAIAKLCHGACTPFPDAATIISRVEDEELGLGYRKDYIIGFCREYETGRFSTLENSSPLANFASPIAAPPESAHADLLAIRGIGEKVAACIELYSLGDKSAVPRDVWIRRAEEDYGIVWDDELAGIQQLFVFYAIRNSAL